MNSIQEVFDNLLLRHKILTFVVHEKYKKELSDYVILIATNAIFTRWHLYCSCDLCKLTRN
uniref:Uncharacterized protein n=1 Tax=viral metagenome TaxID=1070528 RepID=A0A6C0F7Y8_9ZZZZ